MKPISPTRIIWGGLGLIALGFIYDVMFAGIPYQDPTPEMTARYERHSQIASALMTVGTASLLAGLAWGAIRKLAR